MGNKGVDIRQGRHAGQLETQCASEVWNRIAIPGAVASLVVSLRVCRVDSS